MVDPVSLIIGGGLVAAGYGSGRVGRRRRHPRAPKAAPPPKPMCGCSHHYALHDPKTKVCHGTVKTTKYDTNGYQVGYTYPPCACRQYVGPVPMPELFAQEIGG